MTFKELLYLTGGAAIGFTFFGLIWLLMAIA